MKHKVVVEKRVSFRVIVEVETEGEYYTEASRKANELPNSAWENMGEHGRSYSMLENTFVPVKKGGLIAKLTQSR